MLLVVGLSLNPGRARSLEAAGPTLLYPHYVTETRLEGRELVVWVKTAFWDEQRPYSLDEIRALGPALAFHDDVWRGLTLLLAIPPQAAVRIAGVRGEGQVVDWWFTATARRGLETPAVAELVGPPFWFRDQRVQRLRLRPVLAEERRQRLLLHPRLEVRLALEGDWNEHPARPDPHWESLYQQVLANYGDGLRWRQIPPASEMGTGAAPLSANGIRRLRVLVQEPGIQRIPYAQIAALAPEWLERDPRHLQMYRGREKIAILVEGEEDGHLDTGDDILFYAPPWSHKASLADVFWLTLGADKGSRMAVRPAAGEAPPLPGFRDTRHLEEAHIYYSDLPMSEDGDHWYWAALRPGRSGTATTTIAFALAPLAWGPLDATLRLRVLGRDLGTLLVHLWLNEYPLGSFSLADGQEATPSFVLPHFLLRDQNNELRVLVSRQGEQTNTLVLDWLELEYVRRYEAKAGRLELAVDWPGSWRVDMNGFHELPWVWDVTRPLQPARVMDVRGRRGSDGLLTATFVSTASGRTRYTACEPGATPTPQVTAAPAQNRLRDPALQADYLILTPSDLRPAAERLAAYRRSQGLQAMVVELSEVYDAFNAGVA
ncbi:MAG: hypothetical protein D6775_04505, partial [Caldilineae bacterium]